MRRNQSRLLPVLLLHQSGGCPFAKLRSVWFHVRGHQADIRQIAVPLGEVHAVSDDKLVGNGEADVIGVDLFEAARGLVEQRGDAQRAWVVPLEQAAQEVQRQAGIQDVFYEDDVLTFDGLIEVLDELDGAAAALPFAVAGNGHEIEGVVDRNAARQIRQKNGCALEDADENDLFARVIPIDLPAHLHDTLANAFAAEEDLQILMNPGRAHSLDYLQSPVRKLYSKESLYVPVYSHRPTLDRHFRASSVARGRLWLLHLVSEFSPLAHQRRRHQHCCGVDGCRNSWREAVACAGDSASVDDPSRRPALRPRGIRVVWRVNRRHS